MFLHTLYPWHCAARSASWWNLIHVLGDSLSSLLGESRRGKLLVTTRSFDQPPFTIRDDWIKNTWPALTSLKLMHDRKDLKCCPCMRLPTISKIAIIIGAWVHHKDASQNCIWVTGVWIIQISEKLHYLQVWIAFIIASKSKSLRRGVKEVAKALRKGEKG